MNRKITWSPPFGYIEGTEWRVERWKDEGGKWGFMLSDKTYLYAESHAGFTRDELDEAVIRAIEKREAQDGINYNL